MKKQVIYLLVGLIIGAGTLWGIHALMGNGDSTRYVSMTSVFEASTVRKKYEKELEALEQKSNATLAQFENEIRELKKSGEDAGRVAELEKELFAMRDQLTEEYQQKSATFEQVVWEQINRAVAEFGKEKGYDYIFGAKGDGSIMYASDEKDITKEVIAYINK